MFGHNVFVKIKEELTQWSVHEDGVVELGWVRSDVDGLHLFE
jgi:hypothetical protein